MPLNPLQNAVPRQQVPKEAPSYFSPFFPQAPKVTEEISVWKPPPSASEPYLRSKAPNNRPSTPPQIPTVGISSTAHSKTAGISKSKESSVDDGKAQLFRPKEKKSLDEIMWLGSVTGFPPPAPPPPKVEATFRTKLSRKPEDIASQACSGAGGYSMFGTPNQPKDTRTAEQKRADGEAERKKKEEEKARRKRLAEHSRKAGEAQPGEQRVKASGRRGKVFLPIPLPQETARRSNRPNTNHRPNLPHNNSSYAPSNPILPQPIETVRRSNRHAEKAKPVDNEESVWMGLPQPIETVRRSNRKGPLGGGDGKDEKGTSRAEILPQPVESTRRSNRPRKEQGSSPPHSETSGSDRPTENLLHSTQTSDPAVTTSVQKRVLDPPTPTTSFFGPAIVPQPFETTRRSHRPISARPLVPQPIETSRRTNRVRAPQPEMQLEPEGQAPAERVAAPNWAERVNYEGRHHLRRKSTNKPNAPAAMVRDRERERRLMKKVWARPIDHVSHLHEPVDSTPSSPQASPEPSRCPSLSTSPTLSVASSTWDVANKLNKATQGGRPAGREPGRVPVEDGFGPYMIGLEKELREGGALGSAGIEHERETQETQFPFPVVAEVKQSSDQRGKVATESGPERSETLRPRLTSAITDGVLEIKHPQPRRSAQQQEVDDYPICRSPVHGKLNIPWKKDLVPAEDTTGGPKDFNQSRIPTDDLEVSKPVDIIALTNANTQLPTPPDSQPSSVKTNQFCGGPRTAPPRMAYTPMAPSPGYTVASLPPARKKEGATGNEVKDDFVNGVMTYLSLNFDSVAALYEEELALYTGISEAQVRADRKGSVKKYIERWVSENPEIAAGPGKKGGLW